VYVAMIGIILKMTLNVKHFLDLGLEKTQSRTCGGAPPHH